MKIRTQVAMPAWRVLLTSNGCRVMMAAMPPTNAYTAQTNASRSVNEPNTSISLPPLPPKVFLLFALHAALLGYTGTCSLVSAGRGFVLGSAFGLNVFGNELAVGTRTAFNESLRFVNESVWKRICANVADRKGLAFLFKHEVRMTRGMTNAAWGDSASQTHAMIARRTMQLL